MRCPHKVRGRRRAFQTIDGTVDGGPRQERGVLADGGQLDVAKAGELAIVVTQDGHILRDPEPSCPEALPDAQCAAIVEGNHGRGQVLQKLSTSPEAVFFCGAAGNHPGFEPPASHLCPECFAPLWTRDSVPTVYVGNSLMPQRGEIFQRDADTGVVIAADRVQDSPTSSRSRLTTGSLAA